jgi:hypothetical protein
MEMPTPCPSCGEWFDLLDGCNSFESNETVCPSCGEEQKSLKDKIDFWDVTNYEIQVFLGDLVSPEWLAELDQYLNDDSKQYLKLIFDNINFSADKKA